MNQPMPKMLSFLLADIASVSEQQDCVIRGIKSDSRKIQNGDLFILLPVFADQAESYISAAITAGAQAVVAELPEALLSKMEKQTTVVCNVLSLSAFVGVIAARFYEDPSHCFPVVGFTGTNGKTSCSHFFAQAMTQLNEQCGVIGTLGSGVWGELQESGFTTPQAPDVQASLYRFAQQSVSCVAMEVSSHGLQQGRVDGVEFAIAVLTNLSRDHLDYHGDMTQYQQAKARLFEFPTLRTAVLNLDDQFGRELALLLKDSAVRVIGYGIENNSFSHQFEYVHGVVAEKNSRGITLEVTSPFGDVDVQSGLIGHFNAMNLLAVLASIVALGKPIESAAMALSQVTAPAGRMECFSGDSSKALVVVDYAHTPDALEKALQAISTHCQGDLWVVFGCGGDRDAGKRAQMAAVAEQYAQHIIITDDNPRTESPEKIVADIISGFHVLDNVVIEHERKKAIELAVSSANVNDIVLVAGKGHENYQIIGSVKQPYSDRETVQTILEQAA